MRKLLIALVFILTFLVPSCGFLSKSDKDLPQKEQVDKIKEDVQKQVNEITGIDEEKRSRLIKEGIESPAIVYKILDTRVTYNNNPKIRVYVRVKPKDGKEFNSVADLVVSRVNIPRSGDKVTVYYNPKNKEDIIIK